MADMYLLYGLTGVNETLLWARRIRGLILALGLVVSAVGTLFLVLPPQDLPRIWPFCHFMVAALVLSHSYVTLLFLRGCSRVFYTTDEARKKLHGYLYGSMWLIRWFVGLVEFGWLLRGRVLLWAFAAFLALGLLIGPPSTISWMRLFSALVVSMAFWAGVLAWTHGARALVRSPQGTNLLRRLYLAPMGVMSLPGDRWQDSREDLKPSCFLSYHRRDREAAKALAIELSRAGIEVEMYDPAELWADAPYEITERIEKRADCLVYFGKRTKRSPWVRAECAWAERLSRTIFFHRAPSQVRLTIARVYRSARIPRTSLSEHSIISYQDKVFKTYLPPSSIRESRALERTSGLTFMRRIGYDEMFDRFPSTADWRELAIWGWGLLSGAAALGALLVWRIVPSKMGITGVVICGLVTAVSIYKMVVAFRGR